MLKQSKLGTWYLKWIEGVPVPFLNRLALKPNQLTVMGWIISILAIPAYSSSLWLGGMVVLASGVFDTIDGELARRSNQASRSGAFLDSVLDRYSDFFVLLGVWIFFLNHERDFLVVGTVLLFFILLGSFMVSYTRARGEGLGVSTSIGTFGRAERIVTLAFGSILNDLLIRLFPGQAWLTDHFLFIAFLILLVVGTHATALQRIFYLTRRL